MPHKMKEIEASNQVITEITQNNSSEECSKGKRNGREFNYVVNEKRTKAKLLKGAKRRNNLEVEVKSGCVNLRFNDGSYFEVILPLLREFHKREGEIASCTIPGILVAGALAWIEIEMSGINVDVVGTVEV